MSQHDYDLADAAGLSFRADLNNVLAAIISQNSATTEPTTTVAYMFWADTTTAILKQRNAGNSAWISLFNMTTGQWLGAISGNAATVTVADAAADTTTWPMLATSQTGNQAPATDGGLTYNASTNTLTAATFAGNATNATNQSGGTVAATTATATSLNINSGTTITKYLSTTAVYDAPNIPANNAIRINIGLVGVAVGDMVMAQPNSTLELGLVWSAFADVDTVTIVIGNITTSAIDPGSRTWRVSAIKH